MITDPSKQSMHAKKLSDLSYELIKDTSHLSPYHERVTL